MAGADESVAADDCSLDDGNGVVCGDDDDGVPLGIERAFEGGGGDIGEASEEEDGAVLAIDICRGGVVGAEADVFLPESGAKA